MDPVQALLVLCPDHPSRPPNWRWLYGREYTNAPKLGPKMPEYDEYVRKITTLQQLNREKLSPWVIAAEMKKLGPVERAYTLWSQAQDAGRPEFEPTNLKERRSLGFRPVPSKVIELAGIQAHILAGKTPEYIATKYGQPADVITAYENMFYDVRDRLKYPMWVSGNAIGELYQATPYMMIPEVLKAFGYFSKSSRIICEIQATFDGNMTRRAAKKFDTFYDIDSRRSTERTAALAMRMMGLNNNTYEAIIELRHNAKKLEADIRSGTDSDAEAKFVKSVNILGAELGQVGWGYGKEPTNLANERTILGPRLVETGSEAAPAAG